MRLISPRTELAVLKAGTHRNPSISGTVLSGIDESYFYQESSIETFHRIQKHLKKNGEVPSWRDLCEDPKLSEEVRARLKKYAKSDIEPIKSRKEALSAVRRLNEYRQLRGLATLSESIHKKLRKEKVSVEDLLDQTGEDLVSLRSKRSDDAVVVRFGVGNNADAVVKRLLDKSTAEYLPTGFDEFDSKNGGISPGNLFTIGGSSGGGKSTLASQLGINWSEMGEHVCMVPLEMTEDEMTARAMANAAELDVRKILFRKLSTDEEKKYKKAYRKFVMRRKEKEGSLTFWKPKADMTIEEILACTYTMNPSVIVIDYISLLKGVDGDDQWQKLGAVARYCKVYAETHNIIIVLLCQVSEEGKIRYAQAIKEHSNYCWTFVSTKETREAGIMCISQIKARNGELFDFNLKTNMAHMRVRSMTSEERDAQSSKSVTTSKKGKNGGKTGGSVRESDRHGNPKYLKDITDDDDDD
jgi:replicative DNA helicase